MELGEFIRSIRVQKGLTQSQLAENAGVSVNTIRLCETAKISPKAVTLEQIAKALGFLDLENFLYFLNRSTTPEIEKIFDKSVPMNKKIAISRNALHLTPEQVDALCGFQEGKVSKYENELIKPSWDALQKMSTVLKVPLFALTNEDVESLKFVDLALSLLKKKNKEEILTNIKRTEERHELEKSTQVETFPARVDFTMRLVEAASKLNEAGKAVAVQRIKELAEIPRYQAQPTTEATPLTQPKKDTPEE